VKSGVGGLAEVGGGSAAGEPPRRRRAALVTFVLALLGLAATTHRVVFISGNDAARWAHMEALVDHHRSSIEGTRFAGVVDQVVIDGRPYANKPPLLAMAGAGVYFVLQRCFGWSFASGVGMPQIVYWVTLVLVGLPTAALLALFLHELRAAGVAGGRLAAWTTVALGAGTLLLSFGGTLNNHAPSAALLFAAVMAARRGWGLRAGLLGGLATAVDLLPGAGFLPVLAAILWRGGAARQLRRFVAGAAVAAALFVGANLATSGSVLPPLLSARAELPWQTSARHLGALYLPEDWTYPLRCLFGSRGFFVVSPVLVFGAAGMVAALRGRGPLAQRVVVPVAAGALLQVVGMSLVAGAYGGWSYGYRYLIPMAPVLMFFAPLVIHGWRRMAFFALLPVSVAAAALGAYHPWPPVYEQRADRIPVASLVTNPAGGNAACWTEQHWPRSPLARGLGARFISADAGEREAYYALFFRSKADFRTASRYRLRLPGGGAR
jgi:hypothetical protein